jgi:hypothetical protein
MAVKTWTSERVYSSDINTYLTNSGLVYVTGAAFTAASSVSVNNGFSATYDNYRLLINVTSNTVATNIGLRMRAGGVDNSSANYAYAGLLSYTGSVVTAAVTSGGLDTSFILSGSDPTYYPGMAMTVEILQPFLTNRTCYQFQGMAPVNPQPYARWSNGAMSVTTSYDGFTIVPLSGGTLTGTYRLYGYRQP